MRRPGRQDTVVRQGGRTGGERMNKPSASRYSNEVVVIDEMAQRDAKTLRVQISLAVRNTGCLGNVLLAPNCPSHGISICSRQPTTC